MNSEKIMLAALALVFNTKALSNSCDIMTISIERKQFIVTFGDIVTKDFISDELLKMGFVKEDVFPLTKKFTLSDIPISELTLLLQKEISCLSLGTRITRAVYMVYEDHCTDHSVVPASEISVKDFLSLDPGVYSRGNNIGVKTMYVIIQSLIAQGLINPDVNECNSIYPSELDGVGVDRWQEYYNVYRHKPTIKNVPILKCG